MLNATQQDVSLGLVHMLNATQWRWYFLQLPSHCIMVVSAGGSRNDPAGFEDFGGGCGVGGVGG